MVHKGFNLLPHFFGEIKLVNFAMYEWTSLVQWFKVIEFIKLKLNIFFCSTKYLTWVNGKRIVFFTCTY